MAHKKFLITFLLLFLAGCTISVSFPESQTPGDTSRITPTPSTFIPYVDAQGFLDQTDSNRLIFKDWPLSLALPDTWPLDRFTGKKISSNMTVVTFVRIPLPDHKIYPSLSIVFNRIPSGLSTIDYSETLKEQQASYFVNIQEVFTYGDGRIGLDTAIVYRVISTENNVEHTMYIIHATKNDVGVQIIMDTETSALEDIHQEFESIIASLRFEN
jgi:hypothetical protein